MFTFDNDYLQRKAVHHFQRLYTVAIALRARPEHLFTSFRDPLTTTMINFMLTHATDNRFVGIQDIVQSSVSYFDQNETEMIEYFLTYAEDELINEILMQMMLSCEFVPLHHTRQHPLPYLDFLNFWVINNIRLTYEQYRHSSKNTRLMYTLIYSIWYNRTERIPAVMMQQLISGDMNYNDIPETLILQYPQFTMLVFNHRDQKHLYQIRTAFQEKYPEIMKKITQQHPNFYEKLIPSLKFTREFAEVALANANHINHMDLLKNITDQLKIDLHDRVASLLFRFPQSIQYVSTDILITYPDMIEQAVKGCFADQNHSISAFLRVSRNMELILHYHDLCIWVVQQSPNILGLFVAHHTYNEEFVAQLCEVALSQNPDVISKIPYSILHKHPNMMKALYHTENNDAFKSLPPNLLKKLVSKGLESFENDMSALFE